MHRREYLPSQQKTPFRRRQDVSSSNTTRRLRRLRPNPTPRLEPRPPLHRRTVPNLQPAPRNTTRRHRRRRNHHRRSPPHRRYPDNTSVSSPRPPDNTHLPPRNTSSSPHPRSDNTHRNSAQSTTPSIFLGSPLRSRYRSRNTLNVSRTRLPVPCSDNTRPFDNTPTTPLRLRRHRHRHRHRASDNTPRTPVLQTSPHRSPARRPRIRNPPSVSARCQCRQH